MASRAELINIMKELGLDSEGMLMEEMEEAIRKEADKRWRSKKVLHSADVLSVELRKFLTKEYDYKIFNKDKKELDYNLKERYNAGS